MCLVFVIIVVVVGIYEIDGFDVIWFCIVVYVFCRMYLSGSCWCSVGRCCYFVRSCRNCDGSCCFLGIGLGIFFVVLFLDLLVY